MVKFPTCSNSLQIPMSNWSQVLPHQRLSYTQIDAELFFAIYEPLTYFCVSSPFPNSVSFIYKELRISMSSLLTWPNLLCPVHGRLYRPLQNCPTSRWEFSAIQNVLLRASVLHHPSCQSSLQWSGPLNIPCLLFSQMCKKETLIKSLSHQKSTQLLQSTLSPYTFSTALHIVSNVKFQLILFRNAEFKDAYY